MRTLEKSPVGRTQTIRGYDHRFGEEYEVLAFVPDRLPSSVDLDRSTWLAITDASTALGRLDASALQLPNPLLVTRMATRREAVGTSALEGTYANLTDVFAAEVTPADGEGVLPSNVREVVNYTTAAEFAFGWLREGRHISIGLLNQLHEMLLHGSEEVDPKDVGRVRERQVFIGTRNRPITEARFVPPPEGGHLRDLVEDWLSWVNASEDSTNVPVIAAVAVAHYQFETIHPYVDGNGRLGRLIAVLQLMQSGSLSSPVLAISPWLKDREDEYKDHLLEVSHTGDWNPWIEFLATAISEESRNTCARIEALLAYREATVRRVRERLPKARLAVEIAENLIAYPVLNVASAQRLFGRTNQANRDAIGRLVEIGVIEPYSDLAYDRLYWSPELFRIVDG